MKKIICVIAGSFLAVGIVSGSMYCGYRYASGGGRVETVSEGNAVTENADTDKAAEHGKNPNSCGKNIKWSYKDGVLTISGKGAMETPEERVDSVHKMPWYDYMDQIHTIIVKDGVTEISSSAFAYLENLETVELADSVEIIGSSAFSHSGLKSINLPKTLKEIRNCAFEFSGLESIVVPNVQNDGECGLGYDLFMNSKNLKYAKFEDGIDRVPSMTFCECTALETVELPDSVTYIGSSAFQDTVITTINLSPNLEEIDRYAFWETNLQSFSVPRNVRRIGDAAFAITHDPVVKSDDTRNIYIYADHLEEVGARAFGYGWNFKVYKINITWNNRNYQNVDDLYEDMMNMGIMKRE